MIEEDRKEWVPPEEPKVSMFVNEKDGAPDSEKGSFEHHRQN